MVVGGGVLREREVIYLSCDFYLFFLLTCAVRAVDNLFRLLHFFEIFVYKYVYYNISFPFLNNVQFTRLNLAAA